MKSLTHDYLKNQTVGELLAREREARHMSLKELAALTQIKLEHLENLEANRFDRLPAAVFVRGYIKLYGGVLEFDHLPVLAVMRRDFKQDVRGQLISRQYKRTVASHRLRMTPKLASIMGGLTVVLVGLIYVLFRWYQLFQPPQVKLLSPNENQVVTGQVIVEGQTQADTIVTINGVPASLQATGYFSGEITYMTEGIALIKIEVKDARGKTSTVERPVYVKF